jgi:putative membrane protein
MILALILALVFAIVAVIFALQNPMVISVSFLTYRGDWPVALLILISVGLGFLIGVLVMTPGAIRRAWTLGSLRRKVSELEKALEEQKTRQSTPAPSQPASPISSPSPSTPTGESHAQPQ